MLNFSNKALIVIAVCMLIASQSAWAGDEIVNTGSFMLDGKIATDATLESGQTATVTLAAGIPGKKTLRAYSVIINYDPEVLKVEQAVGSKSAAIQAMNVVINEAGTISANGFNVNGVLGLDDGGPVAFIELKVTAVKAGNAAISALFTAFGFDESDQFAPKVAPLVIEVR